MIDLTDDQARAGVKDTLVDFCNPKERVALIKSSRSLLYASAADYNREQSAEVPSAFALREYAKRARNACETLIALGVDGEWPATAAIWAAKART